MQVRSELVKSLREAEGALGVHLSSADSSSLTQVMDRLEAMDFNTCTTEAKLTAGNVTLEAVSQSGLVDEYEEVVDQLERMMKLPGRGLDGSIRNRIKEETLYARPQLQIQKNYLQMILSLLHERVWMEPSAAKLILSLLRRSNRYLGEQRSVTQAVATAVPDLGRRGSRGSKHEVEEEEEVAEEAERSSKVRGCMDRLFVLRDKASVTSDALKACAADLVTDVARDLRLQFREHHRMAQVGGQTHGGWSGAARDEEDADPGKHHKLKSMAKVWQKCGKSVAKVWQECGKSVATMCLLWL